MSAAKYLDIWNRDDLLRFNLEAVSSLQLPLESKRFLVEIGLPRHFYCSFGPIALIPDMPYVSDAIARGVLIADEYRSLRVIGVSSFDVDDHAYFAIDTQNGGRVLEISTSPACTEVSVRFANTSVEQYADFLSEFKRREDRLYSSDGRIHLSLDEVLGIGREFAARLHTIDPAACQIETPDGLDTWWGELIAHVATYGWD